MKIEIVGTSNVCLEVEDVSGLVQSTKNADVLTVVSERRQFRRPGFRLLNNEMGSIKILGGRNIDHLKLCIDYGSSYSGICRSVGLYF